MPQQVKVYDRQGKGTEIASHPHAIAEHTSLYDRTGVRRPVEALASHVEIQAPRLRLNERTVLIDLPGLRDTREMDAVALGMATEADLILWVFRSEPAFSEQDAEFLSILVSTCGPHVVRLLINVICPNTIRLSGAHLRNISCRPIALHFQGI